jgi:hypothetical protein
MLEDSLLIDNKHTRSVEINCMVYLIRTIIGWRA